MGGHDPLLRSVWRSGWCCGRQVQKQRTMGSEKGLGIDL
jgi:hypothetical protein